MAVTAALTDSHVFHIGFAFFVCFKKLFIIIGEGKYEVCVGACVPIEVRGQLIWFSPFPISVASRNQIQVTRLHDKSLPVEPSWWLWWVLVVLFIYLFGAGVE